jgi:hypothetical protein
MEEQVRKAIFEVSFTGVFLTGADCLLIYQLSGENFLLDYCSPTIRGEEYLDGSL